MGVDDAGHHKLASAVDDARIRGRVEILSDAGNLAVSQKHVCVFERTARDGEHRCVANKRFRRGLSLRPHDADG